MSTAGGRSWIIMPVVAARSTNSPICPPPRSGSQRRAFSWPEIDSSGPCWVGQRDPLRVLPRLLVPGAPVPRLFLLVCIRSPSALPHPAITSARWRRRCLGCSLYNGINGRAEGRSRRLTPSAGSSPCCSAPGLLRVRRTPSCFGCGTPPASSRRLLPPPCRVPGPALWTGRTTAQRPSWVFWVDSMWAPTACTMPVQRVRHHRPSCFPPYGAVKTGRQLSALAVVAALGLPSPCVVLMPPRYFPVEAATIAAPRSASASSAPSTLTVGSSRGGGVNQRCHGGAMNRSACPRYSLP